MRPSTREAENADDEPEDNGDHIDLEADTISPNQGSSRRDEALPQSRTSTTVMKKINTIWADSYEIVTENNSTVWFCAAVKRYSESQDFMKKSVLHDVFVLTFPW